MPAKLLVWMNICILVGIWSVNSPRGYKGERPLSVHGGDPWVHVPAFLTLPQAASAGGLAESQLLSPQRVFGF